MALPRGSRSRSRDRPPSWQGKGKGNRGAFYATATNAEDTVNQGAADATTNAKGTGKQGAADATTNAKGAGKQGAAGTATNAKGAGKQGAAGTATNAKGAGKQGAAGAIPLPSADDIMTVLREVRWLRGCIDGVPVWSYTRLEKVAILASLDGIANNLQHFTYQQPGWISTGADEEGPWQMLQYGREGMLF